MKRVNHLKEALCALCRLLSASGSHWDPETLRKSKFNRPEAASEFWNLLYCLLRQIFPGRHDSSPSAHEKIKPADRVRYVKGVLQIQGYGRLGFYSLPDDGHDGSREILLAFSWLLHKVKMLEILLEKKRVKVGDHITICLRNSGAYLTLESVHPYAAVYVSTDSPAAALSIAAPACTSTAQLKPGIDVCPHDASILKCEDRSSSSKQEVDVRFLQWMNGKRRLCWRSLHAARLEECAVLYKLLQAMESEMSFLEAYMEWKRVESVYWQWMDTVLESACEEEHGLPIQNMSTVCTFLTSSSQPQYIPTDIKVLSKCICDTQDQLHKLAILRNSPSQEQMKEIETEFSEKELKKIKQEVKKKMEHCRPQGAEAKDIHGSYRLLLKEHKSVNKDCSMNDVHVTEVTKCLQSVIHKMEAEYCELQDQCKKRLDDITEELQGIVCIPPAKS